LISTQTRAKQVLETLGQTFKFANPIAFALYEMELNLPQLDKMKKHYIKREMMTQQEKINDLQNLPFERELEDDDRLMDIIASWLKRDRSAKKARKEEEKNNKNNNNKNERKKKRQTKKSKTKY
jgi:hypothetical protein